MPSGGRAAPWTHGMNRIVLHIDRLVLRGVDRANAGAVSAALQAELRTLLAQPGAAAAWVGRGDAHALQAGQASVPVQADAASLGRAVAGRIAGSSTP